MAAPRAALCLSLSLGNDGLHHCRRCHCCHHHHLSLSLSLCSSPAPASAPPLPYSCPAPCKLLSCSSPVPAQLLPSFFPALLHYSQLCSCSAPALFLPCSCPAPGPTQWAPQFGSLHHHHQHLTTFFGTARAAFYGIYQTSIYQGQFKDN